MEAEKIYVGKRLRVAAGNFAKMLIEEAHEISGLSFIALDEKLGFWEGQSSRYSRFPKNHSRGITIGSLQTLEKLVANLLKRQEHIVVIENHRLIDEENIFSNFTICKPENGINFRDTYMHTVELGYQDDWPTYHRLKTSDDVCGMKMLDMFAAQWGVLWERNLVRDPFSDEIIIRPEDVSVESLVNDFTNSVKQNKEMLRKGKVFNSIRDQRIKNFYSALDFEPDEPIEIKIYVDNRCIRTLDIPGKVQEYD